MSAPRTVKERGADEECSQGSGKDFLAGWILPDVHHGPSCRTLSSWGEWISLCEYFVLEGDGMTKPTLNTSTLHAKGSRGCIDRVDLPLVHKNRQAILPLSSKPST